MAARTQIDTREVSVVEEKTGASFTTEAVQFAVRLDPQHPAGVYSRAGTRFVAGTDVFFDSVPDAIRTDPWLMVTPAQPGVPPVYRPTDRQTKHAGRRL